MINFVHFYMYFKAMPLNTYRFKIIWTSFLIDLFSLLTIFLYLSIFLIEKSSVPYIIIATLNFFVHMIYLLTSLCFVLMLKIFCKKSYKSWEEKGECQPANIKVWAAQSAA